ncbi:MAG: hypothetical protein ACRCXZ_08510 [Patescibacteria group bacterium]
MKLVLTIVDLLVGLVGTVAFANMISVPKDHLGQQVATKPQDVPQN